MVKELGPVEHGVAGFYSGFVTRALCQPLDVVKIRFQLQEEPIASRTAGGGKYRGLVQATRLIYREEGLGSLWKGHVPAQGLSVIYGAVQFSVYEAVAKHLTGSNPHPTHTANFIAGTVAGVAAVTAAHPLDVARTRLIAQSEQNKVYNSMSQAMRSMWTKEGPLSWYRGWLPAVLYVGPFTGLNFVLFKMFNRYWKEQHPPDKYHDLSAHSQTRHFVCGTVSGAFAKVVTYPFDILKKRLMIVGFEKARASFGTVSTYSGSMDVVRQVIAHEGIMGFYKGLVPSFVKAGMASGLGFLFYEQACAVMKHHF